MKFWNLETLIPSHICLNSIRIIPFDVRGSWELGVGSERWFRIDSRPGNSAITQLLLPWLQLPLPDDGTVERHAQCGGTRGGVPLFYSSNDLKTRIRTMAVFKCLKITSNFKQNIKKNAKEFSSIKERGMYSAFFCLHSGVPLPSFSKVNQRVWKGVKEGQREVVQRRKMLKERISF